MVGARDVKLGDIGTRLENGGKIRQSFIAKRVLLNAVIQPPEITNQPTLASTAVGHNA
jgi:hypothetical protein